MRKAKPSFVKFHWKPVLGVHSLVWDEAQKISGKDPDFQRRDLWESIEHGNFAEYEFGVQMIDEKDEFMFDFDILDATKLWPEEIVPVKIFGKMTLNRNVDNVFAETEQVAFHPGNVVPGIDFTNDPLLQGRLFSYLDTQLIRLGGPNFTEIPINRAVCPFHNNQRNGYSRQRIDVGQVSYHKNSLADNTPSTSTAKEGGFVHYAEKVEGRIIQARSDRSKISFLRQGFFGTVCHHQRSSISLMPLSLKLEKYKVVTSDSRSSICSFMLIKLWRHDGGRRRSEPSYWQASERQASSPALSQANTTRVPYTLKVGVLIGNDFNGEEVKRAVKTLRKYGVTVDIVGEKLGTVRGADGLNVIVNETFLTMDPVLFDSLYVVGGTAENQAKFNSNIQYFINESFKHYKPIGFASTGAPFFDLSNAKVGPGIVFATDNPNFDNEFVTAIAQQRFWNREIY